MPKSSMAPRRPVQRAVHKPPFLLAALTRNSRLLGILLAGVVGVLVLMAQNSSESQPEISTPPTTLPIEQPVEEPSIVPTPSGSPHYIALIIDDIGYSGPLGERAIALPGAVTYAVLPHTPFGIELAELAHSHSKEVMLHAPMSNLAHQPLGPGALTDALSQEDFVATLKGNIDAVPHLQGINNHMGSALTGMQTQMQWVMEVLKERGLYFVDSFTTAQSVAGATAREQEIPTTTRNVFLDNETTAEDIDREFQRLLQTAREKGSAVGIGHPYEETLDYLEKALPALAQENIELISVSAMIRLQQGEGTP
ncbi:MAG: divergent polysaccharide deacetylase family protein [Gammaproteobacteria bacterium]|nr:divergent polysaccharide deacetylase family protein [Gammaproteobacteria bacterium]